MADAETEIQSLKERPQDADALPKRHPRLSSAHQTCAEPLCDGPGLSRLDVAALALSAVRGRAAHRTAAARRIARPRHFPAPRRSRARSIRAALGLFLELAFGISAWKSYEGSTWALRNNPSSGNLHPTEAYVLLDALAGVARRAALYHYAPLMHALEERAAMTRRACCPMAAFCWRSARFPGARPGNMASAPIAIASSTPAMRSAPSRRRPPRSAGARSVLTEPSDDEIAALLGLDRADAAHRREPEHPDLLMWIATEATPPPAARSVSRLDRRAARFRRRRPIAERGP